MKVQEADKIIAIYDEWKEVKWDLLEHKNKKWLDYQKTIWVRGDKTSICVPCYSDSLDKQMPVWKKLRTAPRFYLMSDSPCWIRCDIPIYDGNHAFETQCVGNYKMQEAAAIATAKAIQELNK